MNKRVTTYILAGVPRLTIRTTSSLIWAISPLVVGITSFTQLSVVCGKVLVVVETLLNFQISVSGNALSRSGTYPGRNQGDKKEEDCLDLHDVDFKESSNVCLAGFRGADEENGGWASDEALLIKYRTIPYLLTISGSYESISATI
jgi:hypothetical protein